MATRTRQRRTRDQLVYRGARRKVFKRDAECRYPGCHQVDGCDCAHMHGHTRAQTRGKDPKLRHCPSWMLRLCRKHHAGYDGELFTGRWFDIAPLTDAGAGGHCQFVELATGVVIGST